MRATPLHFACARGDYRSVQHLLAAPGINVHLRNAQGQPAVELAKDYRTLALLKKYMKTCDDFPIHTVSKIVLCGNSGAGKSTLTQVGSRLTQVARDAHCNY